MMCELSLDFWKSNALTDDLSEGYLAARIVFTIFLKSASCEGMLALLATIYGDHKDSSTLADHLQSSPFITTMGAEL